MLYTPHSSLYTLHFTLHTPHFTLHTLHSTLYTPHFTLHTLHSTLCTPHFTLYTLHSTLYTPHSTAYTLHSTLHTLHSTLFRIPQSTVHWYGNRGKMYKTVQITCFTKVFFVTAFGFVGCILFFLMTSRRVSGSPCLSTRRYPTKSGTLQCVSNLEDPSYVRIMCTSLLQTLVCPMPQKALALRVFWPQRWN